MCRSTSRPRRCSTSAPRPARCRAWWPGCTPRTAVTAACPGATCCCRRPPPPTPGWPRTGGSWRSSWRSRRCYTHAGVRPPVLAGGALRAAGRAHSPARPGPLDRTGGRAGPWPVHGRRAGPGHGRSPAPDRRQPDHGRPGGLPADLAAAPAAGVSRPRTGDQSAAVLGRIADRLHAGGARRRSTVQPARQRAGAAPAGRDHAAAARTRDRDFERLCTAAACAAICSPPSPWNAAGAACAHGLSGRPQPSPALPSDARHDPHVGAGRDGNAAAFTASNGSHSGVIVPGTGLHLNNMIGEEDLAAGSSCGPGPADQHAGAQHADADGGCGWWSVPRVEPAALGDHPGHVNIVDHGMSVAEAVRAARPPRGRPGRLRGRARPRPSRAGAVGGAGQPFAGLNLYFGAPTRSSGQGRGCTRPATPAGTARRSCSDPGLIRRRARRPTAEC